MVYKYIIFSSFICICLALDDSRSAKILDYHLEQAGRGHYFFRFASSDGITREEEGNLLNEHLEDSPVVMKGSYSFVDENGKVYIVRYIADETGFHPEGEHIKVPNYVPLEEPNIFIPSTSVRPIFIQTTPRPQYLTSPRVQIVQSTTLRPVIASSSTIESSRIQSTPRTLPFNELDSKLQNSIVTLICFRMVMAEDLTPKQLMPFDFFDVFS